MSLPSPQAILRRLGLRPKKAWGQHFLLYPHQASRIVASLELTGVETVVEIGPGLGALTVFLADQAQKVIALERDPDLARFLAGDLFPGSAAVQVVCQDALRFDFLGCARAASQPLAVAGNLPYQITSPLLFKLIREKAAMARAVLMVQQEVGDRLLAGPGNKDYGVPTVLAQYHFAIARLFSLGPANFYPPPQVASVVLRLTPDSLIPRAADEETFTQVVKAAFAQRRKTLNNTLVAQANIFGLSPEQVRAALESLNIDPKRRGETLSPAQFVELSNLFGRKLGGGSGI